TARGADGAAVSAFQLARELDPKLALDPAYYPPAARARFVQAVPDGPERKHGQIEIDDPQGAVIAIDGRPAGSAPLVREAAEGELGLERTDELALRLHDALPRDLFFDAASTRPPPPRRNHPWYGKWWVWALSGAVVAGTTALAIVALSDKATAYQFPP